MKTILLFTSIVISVLSIFCNTKYNNSMNNSYIMMQDSSYIYYCDISNITNKDNICKNYFHQGKRVLANNGYTLTTYSDEFIEYPFFDNYEYYIKEVYDMNSDSLTIIPVRKKDLQKVNTSSRDTNISNMYFITFVYEKEDSTYILPIYQGNAAKKTRYIDGYKSLTNKRIFILPYTKGYHNNIDKIMRPDTTNGLRINIENQLANVFYLDINSTCIINHYYQSIFNDTPIEIIDDTLKIHRAENLIDIYIKE